MKLESISIKNLRCLKQDHDIDLPPLTLVVGANSSGKSTFVRTFPLLRQSLETITKGPILWFGRFADFGVFKDAVARGIVGQEIEFGFTVRMEKNWSLKSKDRGLSDYVFWPGAFDFLNFLNTTFVKVTLVVSEDLKSASTYTKKIKLEADGRSVEICAEVDGSVISFSIDDVFLKIDHVDIAIKPGVSLFSLAVANKIPTPPRNFLVGSWAAHAPTSPFERQLLEHVEELFHGSSNQDRKRKFVRSLGVGTCENLLEQVRTVSPVTKTSSKRLKGFDADSPWVKDLQGLILADRCPQLLDSIDTFLSSVFREISYIKPLRATAERFYRHQDLAVDEVDPQGANLAMFLMGLNYEERRGFSDWCRDNIGFSVQAKPVGAHVSIHLEDSSEGEVFNVADMGFGYSQLLPVLATMWLSISRGPKQPQPSVHRSPWGDMAVREDVDNLPKIIAIEQPELHLHPRLQAKLADLFCALINESESGKKNIRLVCETHSETIVNEIGKLVSLGRIKPEQVQVLLFEKRSAQEGSVVQKAEFDADGVLSNWPYGFFLPDDEGN